MPKRMVLQLIAFALSAVASSAVAMGDCTTPTGRWAFHTPAPPFLDGTPAAGDGRLVAGVDFMGENDFHVAEYDENANLLMNPSFESGLRYIRWEPGLDWSAALETKDVHSGKFALRPVDTFYSVGTVLRPNTNYTISCWIKSLKGQKGAGLRVQARGNTASAGYLDQVELKTKAANAEWQFCTGTFSTIDTTQEVVIWFSPSNKKFAGSYLVDDMQLSLGPEPSPYVYRGTPYGVEFETGSEDNLLVNARREGGRIGMVFRGPGGTSAPVRIRLYDILGRDLGTNDVVATFGEDMEWRLDLGSDDAFPRGIVGAAVTWFPDGPTAERPDARTYEDYLRFAKFDFQTNTRRHKNLHMFKEGDRFMWSTNRAESLYLRTMWLGMGAVNYAKSWIEPCHLLQEDYERMANYRIEEIWGPVLEKPNYVETLNRQPFKWDGVGIRSLSAYSDELLKWVTSNACEFARSCPHIKYWTLDSEPNGSWTLQTGNRDEEEYAKMLLAVNRGLKQADPANEFCPFGTSSINAQHRENIISILSVMKRMEPETHFKYVEPHTYRNCPEEPGNDADEDMTALIAGLDAIGYDDMKIKTGEGTYYYPMYRPSAITMPVKPFCRVPAKDRYSSIRPSYDLGFGERIGAAMLLRETAVYYKHADRVFANCSWNPAWLDGQVPYSWTLAGATLSEMLGDADFTDDVRFAAQCRAYVFDDNHGHATALVWRGSPKFDRGEDVSVSATLPIADDEPELFDMYGNRCEPLAAAEGGGVTIPLDGYPVYVRVPIARKDRLVEALENIRVSQDLDNLPFGYDVAVRDASTAVIRFENRVGSSFTFDFAAYGGPYEAITLTAGSKVSREIPLERTIGDDAFTPVAIPLDFRYNELEYADTFRFDSDVLAVNHRTNVDWSDVPSVPLGSAGKFSAAMQTAWNEESVSFRFVVTDPVITGESSSVPRTWGAGDGVRLYFDGFANARTRTLVGDTGYDYDDFVFGLVRSPDGEWKLLRIRAPDHQLTGGADAGFVDVETAEDETGAAAIETHATVDVTESAVGYVATVTIPAYYMTPLVLETGGVAPGFAVEVRDIDTGATLSNMTGPIENRPHLWPQLLFTGGDKVTGDIRAFAPGADDGRLYDTLSAAVTALPDGGRIELLRDVMLDEMVYFFTTNNAVFTLGSGPGGPYRLVCASPGASLRVNDRTNYNQSVTLCITNLVLDSVTTSRSSLFYLVGGGDASKHNATIRFKRGVTIRNYRSDTGNYVVNCGNGTLKRCDVYVDSPDFAITNCRCGGIFWMSQANHLYFKGTVSGCESTGDGLFNLAGVNVGYYYFLDGTRITDNTVASGTHALEITSRLQEKYAVSFGESGVASDIRIWNNLDGRSGRQANVYCPLVNHVKMSGPLTSDSRIGVGYPAAETEPADLEGAFAATVANADSCDNPAAFRWDYSPASDGKTYVGALSDSAVVWAVSHDSAAGDPCVNWPANEAKIALLTDYQRGWLDLSPEERVKALCEKPDAPDAYREIKTADFSCGAPVTLAWEGAAGEVTVVLKKGDEVVETLRTTGTSVTVYNLELATEYTWTLSVGGFASTQSFTTEAQPPRLIRSGSMQFVRDLGGWTGLQGCKVRANEIFRGGPPNENKTTSPASLLDDQAIDFWQNRIGLRSEIDFRGSSEHSSSSPMEGLGASYLKYSIDYYKAYAPSETSSGSGKNFLNTLKTILNAAKRPVYFHCAYGRDRTGTVASLVLAILGVSEEDILKDYHATTIRSGSIYKNGLAQPAYYFDSFATFRSDIRKGYPADTFAESVEKYFIALGITKDEIETFRTDMLVGYVSPAVPEPPEEDDPDVPPEVRYSSDGGVTWTGATLVEAVDAANRTDSIIIELCQDVNLPVGSQLAFARANQDVTIRSLADSRHALTRTAAVGGSAEANLKLDASGANLTLENVLVDLGGVKGNIIATISGKSGCCVTLGGGTEIFNADMDDSSVIQLIGANSSLTFDGGVIHDITDANMIVYAKQAASLVFAAGGISNCVVSSEQSVVNLAAGGSFAMTGGFVKDNSATNAKGGIVKTGSASVNISGGEIAGNVWKNSTYGALYIKGTAKFSGSPVIRNNRMNGSTEMNVMVSGGNIRLDGNLDAGACIGVTGGADEGASFGSLTATGFTGAEHFHCDGNAELVGVADGTVLKWKKTAVGPMLVWDVPAGAGGISGFEVADGGKGIAFETVELSATGLKVRFRAGQIDANGETFGLICKTDLTSDATITINATLVAEPGATEGVLTVMDGLSAYTRLFVIGIGAPTQDALLK